MIKSPLSKRGLIKNRVSMHYWPSMRFSGWILAEFSFGILMDQDEFEVCKNREKDQGWYPTMLTYYACSAKDLLLALLRVKNDLFVLIDVFIVFVRACDRFSKVEWPIVAWCSSEGLRDQTFLVSFGTSWLSETTILKKMSLGETYVCYSEL